MDSADIQRMLREVAKVRQDIVARARQFVDDPIAQRGIRIAREAALEVPTLVRRAAEASQWFLEEFGKAVPPNWQRLTNPQIFDAVDLMAGTGWSLIGTPPAETVVALLDAPDAEARRTTLIATEGQVVDDLGRFLARIDAPELLRLRDAAAESLEAYRAGYFKASQALTTTTLSTTIHEQLRERSHGKVQQQFSKAGEQEAAIRDFRWIAVQRALAKTLEPYHPVSGTPERSDYNRNASAHRVKEPQYRQVNALSGLMLLASLLVELDDLADLGRQPAL